MKIFISWSQQLSEQAGGVLRDWLPSVLQATKPFLSSEDIAKGSRWSKELFDQLGSSRFGIICITPENLAAPWLNFEAGALSTSFPAGQVSPFLLGVTKAEVTGPLTQFQMVSYEKDDVRKLLHSINSACEGAMLERPRLDDIFEAMWPRLQARLDPIVSSFASRASVAPSTARSKDEVLEEVLEIVRDQQRLLAKPEVLLPPNYLQHVFRRHSRIDRLDPDLYAEIRAVYHRLEVAVNDIVKSGDGSEQIDVLDRVTTELGRTLRFLGGRPTFPERRPFPSPRDTVSETTPSEN